MTAYPWLKLWIGTADDPKLRAAARIAGCHKAIAVNAWIAALEYAGNHQDRGSVKGLLPEVLAEICDTTREIAVRLFQAFRELGILLGERVAKWGQRQDEKLPKPRTANAERVARCKAKKKAAQGSLDLPPLAFPPFPQTISKAAEEEGVAQRIPESIKNEGDSFGRDAPLVQAEPTNVVDFRDSVGPKLKAQKKQLRREKVMRFINATYSGEEQWRRMNGMWGGDPVHDEQWWFDHCDTERIVAGWDDVRDSRSSWAGIS